MSTELANVRTYLNSLSPESIAEISEKYKEEYDLDVVTADDIYRAIEHTSTEFSGYTIEDAVADGLSIEEYVFWWR